jgi:hypothetical protein
MIPDNCARARAALVSDMPVNINGGYRFQGSLVGSNRGPNGGCENDFVHCVSLLALQNREMGGRGAPPDTRPSASRWPRKMRFEPLATSSVEVCSACTRREATRRSLMQGGHFRYDSGHRSLGWPTLVAGRSITQKRQIRAPTAAARKPSIYARTDACFATADASKLVACAAAVAKSEV